MLPFNCEYDDLIWYMEVSQHRGTPMYPPIIHLNSFFQHKPPIWEIPAAAGRNFRGQVEGLFPRMRLGSLGAVSKAVDVFENQWTVG